MSRIIVGHDEALLAWAQDRYPLPGGYKKGSTTIGFADDKQILAVAIYSNFRQHSIEISFVTSTPRWATKGNIRAVFEYPFRQLGVKRMTAITSRKNKPCRKLLEGVGFRLEGVHPFAHDGVQAAFSYGIYRDDVEARWLKDVPHGR